MRTSLFLVDFSIHLRDSDGNHVYVEVIQKGKEEGEFLEDENAVSNWKLKDVSKLGAFWRVWPGNELIGPLIEISSLLVPQRHIR